MDTFDKFADVLDEATFNAMRTWWNDYAVEHVDPSMVAAADDAFVLSIEAILTVASQWEAVYESDVEPVVKALAAVRVAETLADSDIIDLSALTTTQTTKMINTLESMRDALTFISERGIDISNVEYVVALPNWDNYIDAYAATRRNLVVGMPETVYRDLVTQLSAASRDGFDIWERTKLVRSFLSWEDEGGYDQWLTRAQRISRTETNGLLNSADLHAWKTEAAEIDDEVEMHKVFVATLDPRTRDTHFAADGQRVPLDGKFNLGGYEIDHPGDQSLPAHESINCVIGETQLDWAGQGVTSSTKREHVGTFVDLTTANGHTLTVTPNHPILTPSGYVPAGSLSEGDSVVSTDSASAPQVDHMPPRADQFHRALREAGVRQGVVGSAVDFHGDAAEGNEVEVVRPDRDLRAKVNTLDLSGSVDDARLVNLRSGTGGLATLRGGRGTLANLVTLVDAGVSVDPARDVSGSRQRPPVVFPELAHANPVSLAAASHGQIEFVKPADDDGAADAELSRHLQNAHALGMKSTQLVEVNIYSGRHYVYNLSTTDEWYIANGIAVHNCRCTMMRVRADEDVPDDTDRQTERERIHKGRDVPARDPQAEVRSRARRGVTRDGDNDDDQPLIASGDDTMTRTQWSGILAPINKPTGDGRIFDSDADLSFREFPLPLMFQRATSDGHNTAVVVGKISDATIESDGVHATGEFFDSEDAREAAELVAEGVMRPSVDLTDMIVEHELIDADGNSINIEDDDIDFEDIANEIMHVRAATIMAATLVSKPAFAEAKIVLGEQTAVPADDERQQEENALLASAATLVETVDRTMFSDPQLDAPTALTMTDDGRVFGHLALWGTEHIARPGTTPPRSRTDYAMFHTSSVTTEEGPISVGRLTVGTGHADARANSRVTAAHYDNTGATWALVRAGEDAHGIWVSGIVDASATEAQIREGLSAPLSGDWRNIGGNLELVAALSVNTPGFPVPRSYAVDNGREMSLVASGVVRRASKSDQLAHAVAEGLRLHDERRARIDAERDRQRSARVMAAQMLAKGL